MFTQSQDLYDLLYEAMGKDYSEESSALCQMIEGLGVVDSREGATPRLLDVACGTGRHLELLTSFDRVGIDIEPRMVAIASDRCPGIPMHQGDMRALDVERLGGPFDVVTCLFSAIAYMADRDELLKAVHSMAQCLKPGGVLLVEPFLDPEEAEDGYISALNVDTPSIKITRMNVTRMRGNRMLLDFHYLVAQASGVEHFSESHALTLFTTEEYAGVFEEAGLRWSHDTSGLCGRGMHIGQS